MRLLFDAPSLDFDSPLVHVADITPDWPDGKKVQVKGILTIHRVRTK